MKKINVMLVDDQVLLREGLKTIINLQNHMEVIGEASNGKEALALLKEMAIDVILMDIRMPEMDGIEATLKIKRDYPSIAIIVLTTFNEESLIIDALVSGADGYLLKDIDAEHLVKAIEDAYNGNLLLPTKVATVLASRLSGHHTNPSTHIGFGIAEELTERELEVGRLLSEGMTNKQIANMLFLSEGTVKNYISEIYKKLGTSNRTKAGIRISGLLSERKGE